MAKWWEKEPIRFECQANCFKCCIKPGIVNFDREDIRKAADFLKTSPAEFKKTFLTRDEGYWVIEVQAWTFCFHISPFRFKSNRTSPMCG